MANLVCMLVPARHLATVTANFGEMSTDIFQGLQSCLESVLTLKEHCIGIPRQSSCISSFLKWRSMMGARDQQADPLPLVPRLWGTLGCGYNFFFITFGVFFWRSGCWWCCRFSRSPGWPCSSYAAKDEIRLPILLPSSSLIRGINLEPPYLVSMVLRIKPRASSMLNKRSAYWTTQSTSFVSLLELRMLTSKPPHQYFFSF